MWQEILRTALTSAWAIDALGHKELHLHRPQTVVISKWLQLMFAVLLSWSLVNSNLTPKEWEKARYQLGGRMKVVIGGQMMGKKDWEAIGAR